MSLQEHTDEIVSGFAKQAPELYETWKKGIAKVEALGLPDAAPRLGAKAPGFRLTNLKGREVALDDLVAKGPVVLKLIRGSWCPFCSVEFAAWKKTAPAIRELGATLVMITPEKDETAAEAFADAPFEVLLDGKHALAKSYGIEFDLPEELLEVHGAFEFQPEKINADGAGELPSPALFVIDREAIVRWRFVEANYTKRAEPADVLAVLRELA